MSGCGIHVRSGKVGTRSCPLCASLLADIRDGVGITPAPSVGRKAGAASVGTSKSPWRKRRR